MRGGVREVRAVLVADVAAARVRDRRAGQLGGQCVQQGGNGQAVDGFGIPVAEVTGHAVAAEEGQRIGGQRPDHRDARVRPQRQGGLGVGEQHDGFLGQPAGQRPVPRRVQVDGRVQAGRGVRICGRPSGIEQAELALLPQHPGRGPVDQLGRDQAVVYRGDQLGAVAADAGQFHVQAGVQGQRPGLRGRPGHPVLGLQEGDREVVRDHDPVEAELIPQQPGQQRAVPADRDAVHIGVGRHHRAGPAEPQRHLERHQHHVGELPRPHTHRSHVAAHAGRGVASEMLQRGLDPGRLQAADVAGADRPDQVRVLADGFLGPPPAHVPGHVEDRGQALVDAHRSHAGPDGPGHVADQVGIERRPPGQRGREHGGRPGGEAGQAFLVRDGGNTEPARPGDLGLQIPQPAARHGRRQRPGAEHPGDLAEAVADELSQRPRNQTHLALHGGDVGVPGLVAEPDAAQLGDLLRQCHPAEQVRDPLGGRPRRVAPDLVRDRARLAARAAHRAVPGTSPVDSRMISSVDSSTRLLRSGRSSMISPSI